MQTIPPLDVILFDPLSWMHPRRLPLAPPLSGCGPRSIINDMVIAAQCWSTQRPEVPEHGLAAHFIRHWHALPQVALLMACQRHRALLSRQGRLRLLPGWARQFAELAIVESSAGPAVPVIMPDTLLAWGKSELLACGPWLPLAIQQRIPLLFSPDMDRSDGAAPAAPPSPLLIKLACQYAKRNPAIPDAAEFRRSFNQA
ncbi:type III secretion apparatus protein OrgA/MxiK [Sodalis sp. RH21]|uniref:type III secretion apparatus protein OrgA/MxiK n=1 Tax=unclassified Sodalis (in: enterobacteria) TaxID=2636512 RepID=UPI0039B3D158